MLVGGWWVYVIHREFVSSCCNYLEMNLKIFKENANGQPVLDDDSGFRTWFTSDTHFSHGNIIKYSKRPFLKDEQMSLVESRSFCVPNDQVKEHDDILIENWNRRVRPHDVVYHLGDFAFCRPGYAHQIFNRLNGKIHLVLGNHDSLVHDNPDIQDRLVWHRQYAEISVNRQKIVLCHYAFRVWNRAHHGSWNLYGHSHGSLVDDPNAKSFDVGIDSVAAKLNSIYGYRSEMPKREWYCPISFEELNRIMEQKKYTPVDHHNERTT